MQISTKDWKNYIGKLRKLSDTAAEKMQQYVQKNGFGDTDALIEFAYGLVTKYGEGSAEMACEMYDAIAEIEGAAVPAAVPADTASYAETARAVQGSLLQSPSGQKLTQIASRLVKQAGADTTMKNAIRDGAQFAWIPSGDSCAFCFALASRGWQYASKKALKGGHAEHIHANCDCQYTISFNGKTDVAGYDPEAMREEYYAADGNSSKDRINFLRRKHYAQNAEKIRAQKREAYAARTEKQGPTALSANYFNKDDYTFEKIQNVPPYKDFEDYGIHGKSDVNKVVYETNNGQEVLLSAEELADIIKEDPNYKGGKVRLLSCGMGNEANGFGQALANSLGKKVMAPTETLWLGDNGETFVSNNQFLAEMWYNDGEINNDIKPTGTWKIYKPKKG